MEGMEGIDELRINFSDEAVLILQGVLTLLMFSIALNIKVQDFKLLLRQPKPALVGLLSEYIYLPLITLALIHLLNPPTSVALGMILLSVCPGGSTSNYATHIAKANTALSVMLTSVTTLGAAVITPLAFSFWQLGMPEHMRSDQILELNFFDMAVRVFLLVMLPVILGVYINERYPERAAKLRRPFNIASAGIFITFVTIAVFSNITQIKDYIHIIFGLTALHNGLGLLGGFLIATLFGLKSADRRTVTLETGIQNSGLGMTLVFTFFSGLGGMAVVLAWWGIYHLFTGFGLAYFWGKRPPKD